MRLMLLGAKKVEGFDINKVGDNTKFNGQYNLNKKKQLDSESSDESESDSNDETEKKE